MANLVRGAFGQSVPIGTIYDAVEDKFLPASILPEQVPLAAISTKPSSKENLILACDDTFTTRFGTLEVNVDTAVSILAGLFLPQGSGVYLRDIPSAQGTLRGALYHKITKAQQRVNLSSCNQLLDLAPLQTHRGTHVVTGIDWGLQSILALTHPLSKDEVSKTNDAFQRDLDRLKTIVESISPNEPTDLAMDQLELDYSFTLYTDALKDEGLILQDVLEVREFMKLIPNHITHEAGGKGWELSYTLLPIGMLQYFTGVVSGLEAPLVTISAEYLTNFVELFDEFAICEEKLMMYRASLAGHKRHVPHGHVRAVAAALDLLQHSKQATSTEFGKVLVDVRCGKSDVSSLRKLFEDIVSTDKSPTHIAAIAGQESAKLELISMAVAKGASYIGYTGLNLARATKPPKGSSSYVFLFSHAAMKDSQTWHDNFALLSELLDQKDQRNRVYIADCDAPSVGVSLEEPRISQYQCGKEVVPDLLDERIFLAGKCFARYRKKSLESTTDNPKPVTRRFVKIPCPGINCQNNGACEWTCSRCHAPIECGFTDKYFYCDCGRVMYDAFEFKCNAESHGPGFSAYEPEQLFNLCKQLDQSDYLNILILGETGVGKSTFINAFVNYVSYATLDEAKAATNLDWLIPCSFSIQVMDRTNPGQAIEEKHVRVGAREDEADGSKGASATQQTTVYSVTIGSTTYRLIDTPGIGDTRGISYDKKNMADILDTLSGYENLHGILILLKSNNARLNTTFRFCVKELLAHLHRGAVENMTFGFTNTRISNYTPGDTFGPLKALLEEHSDIGLTLSTPTTYCFDSESFRYLAAYKNGIPLPNEEDFRRSWEHSSREAHRMIDHFKSKPPHNIKSTLSLNGARELIIELTKPMAEISQLIRENISMFEDRKQELLDTKLTAESLRQKLHLEKIQFNSKALDQPRTVCHMASCCEFRDSGKGDGEVVTIYKTHCHAVCYLDNVKQDVVADPGLIYCAAFSGQALCEVCGHHWQEHMHVLYELEETTVQVKDTEIERQLQANADDVTLRQAGINDVERLINEFDKEHKEIQEAAARFGLFLQEYAMTPINDATADYIEMLIQNEEAKINAGRAAGVCADANKKRLRALQEDKAAHLELVKTLTGNMKAPQKSRDQVLNEKGVERLVHKLYSLPHFGKNLKSVKNTITTAHQATYRERPYRVRQSRYDRGSGSSSTYSGSTYSSSMYSSPMYVKPSQGRAVTSYSSAVTGGLEGVSGWGQRTSRGLSGFTSLFSKWTTSK